jgi:hypothetical protein
MDGDERLVCRWRVPRVAFPFFFCLKRQRLLLVSVWSRSRSLKRLPDGQFPQLKLPVLLPIVCRSTGFRRVFPEVSRRHWRVRPHDLFTGRKLIR